MNKNLILSICLTLSAVIFSGRIPFVPFVLFALACNFAYKAKSELKSESKGLLITAWILYIYTAISTAIGIFSLVYFSLFNL